MRLITKDMANAFYAGRKFNRDNTMVTFEKGVSKAYLHGNLIATYCRQDGMLEVTLAGWNTVTTRERVNGLLPARYGITTKLGQAWLSENGEKRTRVEDGETLVFIDSAYDHKHN